jgi:hypothetical protein
MSEKMEPVIIEKITQSKNNPEISQLQIRSTIKVEVMNKALSMLAPSIARPLENERVAWQTIDNAMLEAIGATEGLDLNELLTNGALKDEDGNPMPAKCRIYEVETTDITNGFYQDEEGNFITRGGEENTLRAKWNPKTNQYARTVEGELIYVTRQLEIVDMDEDFREDSKFKNPVWISEEEAEKITNANLEKHTARIEAETSATTEEVATQA